MGCGSNVEPILAEAVRHWKVAQEGTPPPQIEEKEPITIPSCRVHGRFHGRSLFGFVEFDVILAVASYGLVGASGCAEPGSLSRALASSECE